MRRSRKRGVKRMEERLKKRRKRPINALPRAGYNLLDCLYHERKINLIKLKVSTFIPVNTLSLPSKAKDLFMDPEGAMENLNPKYARSRNSQKALACSLLSCWGQ